MENSHRFFANKECKYYPCHKNIDQMNCLFCFCPLYDMEKCPGQPQYTKKGDKVCKNCTECIFPHISDNYDIIINILKYKLSSGGMRRT